MLQFFRRIRQKLLTENSFRKPASPVGKYLLYAMGEIILVVIGILIALQVNNWNEARKDKLAETKALVDLQKEFISNKKIFDEHIREKERIRKEGIQFLSFIRGPAIPSSQKSQPRPSVGRRTYNPSLGMINAIMNSNKIDKLENDSLRYWLSNWKDIILDFQEEEKEQQYFISNIIYPYEAAILPLTIDGKGGRLKSEQSLRDSEKANMDRKYQNLLIKNYQFLGVQLEESQLVANAFNQIQRLLKMELSKK